MSAANAQVYQNDLIRKTATQLFEYNHEDLNGQLTRPALDYHLCTKYWGYLTKGLSTEELADLEAARDQLQNYEKLYSLIEYSSKLHEGMTCLEKRIQSNNPTIPMNMYRHCQANSQKELFPEMEAFLQAYYDLIDDCKDLPLWERKLQEDLGGSVSFLGIMMEEALRDQTIAASPVYERFDSEKQLYFK